jgi:hypothetical protein
MRGNAMWMVVSLADMLAMPDGSLRGVDRWSVLSEDVGRAH